MRSIFLNCLKAARGEESSRFQDATELEAVFEEEYAKILGEVAWPQHRMYWLGEKVYLYDDEIEDVIVAVVVSIKEVRGDLSFVLADEQDRFEIDLHTKDTLGKFLSAKLLDLHVKHAYSWREYRRRYNDLWEGLDIRQ